MKSGKGFYGCIDELHVKTATENESYEESFDIAACPWGCLF
jgi:hypothetical protein